MEAELKRRQRNRIDSFYPDAGPLRRELYVKHCAYFAAGVTHSERLAISANRIGKTEGIGAYETSVHATGLYPPWWTGRRFKRPIKAWVAGKTGETTRDILQAKLLGQMERTPGVAFKQAATTGLGTGMIPGHCIISITPKSGGIADAIDTVWVRHVSGGMSMIGFKSYGKDRDSFEGTEKDLVWLDEEPPKDVYDECLMRLMSTVPGQPGGLMLITFTPIEGDTEVVRSFLEQDSDPDKFFVQIGWVDAPHISAEEIEKMSKKYLPSQLRARSLGEPALGEGAIYPIDIEDLLTDDIAIPKHWKRAFGLDVGKTAVVWGALNPDTDVLHLYKEYYSEEYNVLLHAAAMKGIQDQDKWIPGVADPAALQSSQIDGQKLLNIYRGHGVNVTEAGHKLVEAGISEVWERMVTGRLKVFRSLNGWRGEFGRYHRRKKETELGMQSKIVKKFDHRMDATRYLVTDGLALMKAFPIPRSPSTPTNYGSKGWMA